MVFVLVGAPAGPHALGPLAVPVAANEITVTADVPPAWRPDCRRGCC